MSDDISAHLYDTANQPQPNALPLQPLDPDILVAEEPTASVFQVGASPWMRGAIQSQNSTSHQPPTASPRRSLLADMNIISQEEKEQLKVEREKKKRTDEIRERQIKEKEQRDLQICRNYFIVGCFGLPFLLWVNVLYFLDAVKPSSGNFRVRKYVWLSLIVALVETFLWVLWFVVFQLLRETTLSAFDITRSNFTIGLLA